MKPPIEGAEDRYTEDHPQFQDYLDGIEAQCDGTGEDECPFTQPHDEARRAAWLAGWHSELDNRLTQQGR